MLQLFETESSHVTFKFAFSDGEKKEFWWRYPRLTAQKNRVPSNSWKPAYWWVLSEAYSIWPGWVFHTKPFSLWNCKNISQLVFILRRPHRYFKTPWWKNRLRIPFKWCPLLKPTAPHGWTRLAEYAHRWITLSYFLLCPVDVVTPDRPTMVLRIPSWNGYAKTEQKLAYPLWVEWVRFISLKLQLVQRGFTKL